MATLSIMIDLNNDAFAEDREAEIGRILYDLSHLLVYRYESAESFALHPLILRDVNGNSVGSVAVTS